MISIFEIGFCEVFMGYQSINWRGKSVQSALCLENRTETPLVEGDSAI